MLAPVTQKDPAETRATQFKLSNGMDVVVIPDHRSSVVTHMVWYRVGAADSPPGYSGIAHFLEHLMFKSTDKIPAGEFAKIISRLGGINNAFTSKEFTAYHQRVAKHQLKTVMDMEADRMAGLRIFDEEVATERQVILEERASRVDNNPTAQLSEQLDAALYLSHPYGVPVIGWAHEIAHLSRDDLMRFYKQHYVPNNAVLVVAGDVTPEEVRQLAEGTYGKIPANPDLAIRSRPQEPPHTVARRLMMKAAQAGSASFHRHYLVPSFATAKPGEVEALVVLVNVLGEPSTGRLFRKLVIQDKVAAAAFAQYVGIGIDSGLLVLFGAASNGDLEGLESALDEAVDDVRTNGVSELELERAKKALRADFTFESDDQMRLAQRYGSAIASGRSVQEVEDWPARISMVTPEDVKTVAEKYLDVRHSVTGWLIPDEPDAQVQK